MRSIARVSANGAGSTVTGPAPGCAAACCRSQDAGAANPVQEFQPRLCPGRQRERCSGMLRAGRPNEPAAAQSPAR